MTALSIIRFVGISSETHFLPGGRIKILTVFHFMWGQDDHQYKDRVDDRELLDLA